jgi:hypothetical protein
MEKKRKNRRRYCLIGRYERVFYITVGGNSISLLLYVVPDRFPRWFFFGFVSLPVSCTYCF